MTVHRAVSPVPGAGHEVAVGVSSRVTVHRAVSPVPGAGHEVAVGVSSRVAVTTRSPSGSICRAGSGRR
ncbi:hypothetical protein GCM10023147_09000 [Tsukamurella soli]|uniref:Uncharacterized protein n=1 Tax=Tsukamurella soli TaxID=644556 RepID=A0ABP8J7K5_9ACTN